MMADPASFIASWLTPSSLFILVNLVIGTIAISSRFSSSPQNEQVHHPQLLRSPSLLQRLRSFNLTHHNTHHYQPNCTQPQLVPTPSLLDRVTSFNLSLHKHQPTRAETQHVHPEPEPEKPPELLRTPSLLERVTSFRNLSLHKHVQPEPEPEPEPDPEKPELVRSPSLLQRIQSINFSHLYRSDFTRREDSDPDPSQGSGKAAEMRKSASVRGSLMDSEWEEVEKRRPQTARPAETTTSWIEDEEVDAKADDFINRFKKQLRLQRIDSLLRYRGDNSS